MCVCIRGGPQKSALALRSLKIYCALNIHMKLGKGKIVLVLNLIKHYAMKEEGGVDVQIHIFLTSALIGGEWSDSRPCSFIPGKDPAVPIGQEDRWAPEPLNLFTSKIYSRGNLIRVTDICCARQNVLHLT
jgi:hypothetical protein